MLLHIVLQYLLYLSMKVCFWTHFLIQVKVYIHISIIGHLVLVNWILINFVTSDLSKLFKSWHCKMYCCPKGFFDATFFFWLYCYCTSRSISVIIWRASLTPACFACGLPQIYILGLEWLYLYADDTQLYGPLRPGDTVNTNPNLIMCIGI